MTVWCAGLDGTAVPFKPAHQTVTYIQWHIPDVTLIQFILLMMNTEVLETCRELECIYTRKTNCASSWLFTRILTTCSVRIYHSDNRSRKMSVHVYWLSQRWQQVVRQLSSDKMLLARTVNTAAVWVKNINFVQVIRYTVIPLDVFINTFSKYLNSNENYCL